MKQLLFSLLFVSLFGFSTIYAADTTEQQTNNLLNYINSTSTKTAITRTDIQEFYNTVQKQTKYRYLSEEDESFLILKKDQSVANYLKAIQVENALRLTTGQALLPDPTTSTTQIPQNDKATGVTLEGQAPRINGTVLPITPSTSTNITAPTSVSFLDKLIPLNSFAKSLNSNPLDKIFNQLFFLGLIIAVVLAVIMIIRGGIEYMTTDAIAGKESGKKRVQAALGGLLLAFSAVLILNTINPGITNLKIAFPGLSKVLETNITGGITSGSRFDATTGEVIPEGVVYRDAPGEKEIGGGLSHLDTDGSPGSYKVEEDPNGKHTINGKKYRSVGTTNLANAGSNGNWYGVKTDNGEKSGNPIINSDGTLVPQLSYGNGTINGDTTPFVALSSAQLGAAKLINPSFRLGYKVLLTANGKTIEAIYADNAGTRPLNYSEVSPAAAEALGLNWGAESGKTWIEGDITISLP